MALNHRFNKRLFFKTSFKETLKNTNTEIFFYFFSLNKYNFSQKCSTLLLRQDSLGINMSSCLSFLKGLPSCFGYICDLKGIKRTKADCGGLLRSSLYARPSQDYNSVLVICNAD